jgi:uncharacterized protein YbjT (DUF2867 family)
MVLIMSDIATRPVLVAGATGRQGGSVLRHLIERRIPVRALIRSSEGVGRETLRSAVLRSPSAIWTIRGAWYRP